MANKTEQNTQPNASASPKQRGIILIFIVVLLVLLAIMGVAFLATARADRASITGRGAAPNAPMESVLKDRTTLNESFNTVKNEVMYRLVRDLMNYTQTNTVDIHASYLPSQFRPVGGVNNNYTNKDAYGISDPHLASPLPSAVLNSGSKYVRWNHISAPLARLGSTPNAAPFMNVPRFFDPRTFMLNTTTLSDNQNLTYDITGTVPEVYVSGVAVRVPDTAFGAYADATARSRAYPALFVPSNNNTTYIAADSDGDGQADAGLAPIKQIDGVDNDYDVYEDPRNPGVVYFYSYRVVDNSALINVNTAFSAKGDFKIANLGNPDTQTPIAFANLQSNSPNLPNLGFSRSNVGLLELMQVWLSNIPTAGTFPYNNEAQRLLNYRVRNVVGDATTATNWTSVTSGTAYYPRLGRDESGATYQFSSSGANSNHLTLGDSFEVGINRRLGNEGYSHNNSTFFGAYSTEDVKGLKFRNGAFLNPIYNATTIEQTLKESTYWTAVNFAPSRSEQFGFIPPTRDASNSPTPVNVINWFDWIYNFQPPSGWFAANNWGLDSAAGNDFAGLNRYEFPTGSGNFYRRSIRTLLTGVNGVTATAPLRGGGPNYDVLTSNVIGRTDMPAYTGTDSIGFTKASAATSQFGELWRAYWSIMVDATSGIANANPTFPIRSVRQQGNIQPPSMFLISQRSNGTNGFRGVSGNSDPETARMAILRSAIAALNTIDLRDPDDDLSVASIQLDRTNGGVPSTTLTADVAGHERQPYITGVAVRTGGITPNNRAIVIELFNPYNQSIDLWRFGFVIVSRNESNSQMTQFSTTVINFADPGMTSSHRMLPGEFRTIEYSPTAVPVDMKPVVNATINITPGNVNLLVDGIGKEIFLVRKAKANLTFALNNTDNISKAATGATPDDALFAVDYIDLRLVNMVSDQRYQYRRDTTDWKFTYGGSWVVGAALQNTNMGPNVLGATHGGTFTAPVMQLQTFEPTQTSTASTAANRKTFPETRFPFGSPFARDGDLLTIPFIGNYVVRGASGDNSLVHEMNSIPADAYASDPNPVSPVGKQVGRFVQVDPSELHYAWTQMLPEVISARQAPNAMYTPDVPAEYIPQTTTQRSAATNLTLIGQRDPANGGPPSVNLLTVYSGTATAHNPDKVAGLDPHGLIQGRINVNTAPEVVRKLLPWRVNTATGQLDLTTYASSTQTQLQSANGFSSIYHIPLPAESTTGTYVTGDLSYYFGTSGVMATSNVDFEQKFRNQIRVSNLVSTRSDSYTVYICVQAWRTDGTSTNPSSNPVRLLAERRGAYLVDRGVITPQPEKLNLATLLKEGVTVIEED